MCSWQQRTILGFCAFCFKLRCNESSRFWTSQGCSSILCIRTSESAMHVLYLLLSGDICSVKLVHFCDFMWLELMALLMACQCALLMVPTRILLLHLAENMVRGITHLINYKFIILQPFIRFVDVSAMTAAFIRMTVHCQVSTRRPAGVNLIKGCNMMNL